MNHSPTHTLHVRRIWHVPTPSPKKPDDPIVLRRTYDISAACGRESDGDDGAVRMHIRLARTTPLVRCAAIGAAVVGVVAAVAVFCRARQHFLIRRKYARRYAERLRLQKQRMRIRQNDSVRESVPKP